MLSRSFARRAWAPLVIALAVPLTLQGQELNGQFRLDSTSPPQAGNVRVGVSRGHGEDTVAQQPASANGRSGAIPTLQWSGDVDVVAEIRWGASGVTQHKIGGGAVLNPQSSQSGGGLKQGGTVYATLRAGRGTVQVVQQPSAENNWTAVIRVHDPQPGYGHYQVEVTWQ